MKLASNFQEGYGETELNDTIPRGDRVVIMMQTVTMVMVQMKIMQVDNDDKENNVDVDVQAIDSIPRVDWFLE